MWEVAGRWVFVPQPLCHCHLCSRARHSEECPKLRGSRPCVVCRGHRAEPQSSSRTVDAGQSCPSVPGETEVLASPDVVPLVTLTLLYTHMYMVYLQIPVYMETRG